MSLAFLNLNLFLAVNCKGKESWLYSFLLCSGNRKWSVCVWVCVCLLAHMCMDICIYAHTSIYCTYHKIWASRPINYCYKLLQVKRSCFPLRPGWSFWNDVHLICTVTWCISSLSFWCRARGHLSRYYFWAYFWDRISGILRKTSPKLLRTPGEFLNSVSVFALIKIGGSLGHPNKCIR